MYEYGRSFLSLFALGKVEWGMGGWGLFFWLRTSSVRCFSEAWIFFGVSTLVWVRASLALLYFTLLRLTGTVGRVVWAARGGGNTHI